MSDDAQKDPQQEEEKKEEPQKEEAPKEEPKKEEAPKEEVKKEEPKKEEKKEAKKDIKLSASAQKILDEVEKLSVLELADLVKPMEDKFGVSAAAPVAVAAAGGGGGDGGGAEEAVKDSFTVELSATGDKKIAVIKVVKDILGLGLKDAKDIVDAAPKAIKENVPKKEADELKAKLEAEGATVELK